MFVMYFPWLLLILLFYFSIPQTECSDAAVVYCYVCMDRDMDSCKRGNTSCTGYCYKVTDEGHKVVAKGCALNVVFDGDPVKQEKSNFKPGIELYWTRESNETHTTVGTISGHGHFCRETGFMCNSATKQFLSLSPYWVTFGVLVFLTLR